MAGQLPSSNTISTSEADALYDQAGVLVETDEDQISLERYSHILKDDVALVIKEVLDENPLPFKLAPFQLLALRALGSKQNALLLSPTGSGKMLVAQFGVLVLAKIMGIENAVGIGTQPLRKSHHIDISGMILFFNC